MIIVQETWHLRATFANQAQQIMQEMDDLVGPPAHAHPGWIGHAAFCQNLDRPTEIVLRYQWTSRESHRTLVSSETTLLAEFTKKYCEIDRQIDYFEHLDVDVDEH